MPSPSASLLTGIFSLVLGSLSVFPLVAGTSEPCLAAPAGTREIEAQLSYHSFGLPDLPGFTPSSAQSFSVAIPQVFAGWETTTPREDRLLCTAWESDVLNSVLVHSSDRS